MDRTTARKMYNEFTTEVDLKSPGGLVRSGDVDHYIEKVLKPLVEEGKAFKRADLNERTGIRSTRYSYRGGKAVQDSVNAVLANMPEALGYELDENGNVAGTDRPPPIAITNQGRHYYNETKERILDPRTAAAIRMRAIRAGGVSNTDKASGYTTTMLRAGLSGETREMRKLVDTTDAKYFSGELPPSAFADGASPATMKERAKAQVARQANIKDAKLAAIEEYIAKYPTSPLAYEVLAKLQRVNNREDLAKLLEAERTPGTREFDNKIFRNIRAREAREDAAERFIEANPNSRTALAVRKEKWSRRGQKAKRTIGGAARFARNALFTTVGTILSVITTGVGVLMKSYQIITQIGSDIRKRAVNEAKYNFEPDTIRQFEIFANKRGGMDKELLVRAAGGIHSAWSTPLNYAESGFNQLAPYLREGTVKLVSMATANGDANILNIMSSVIDDLVAKSLSGVSGAKTFNPGSAEGRHRAFSGNLTALTQHNEAWGELMNQYWHDFLLSGASSIDAWKVDGRAMNFENWVTQGSWSSEYHTDTGISSPVIRTAAEGTHALVSNFIETYSNLAADIATAMSGSVGDIVEWLRSIVNNWLAPYFPAFAMKENQRAIYLNQQSKSLAQSLLPGYESEARRALLDIRWDGDLTDFREVIDSIAKGDTSKIPYHIDLEKLRSNMGAFSRYYHVTDILNRVQTEEDKASAAAKSGKDYVQRHIVGTSASIATVSGEQAMILQHQLDKGARNTRVQPASEDSQYTFTDYLKQLGIGLVNVPNVVGQAVNASAQTFDPRTKTLEDRIQQILDKEIPASRKTPLGKLPGIGTKALHNQVEKDFRELVKRYDKQGHTDLAISTLERLHKFYLDYPEDLVKNSPNQAQALREKIKHDAEWLWMGDNFAEASQVFHPAELAAETYKKIKQVKAQQSYAAEHADLASSGAAQQRMSNETTMAGLYNKINERITAEVNPSQFPDLQNVYHWLAANRSNSVYLDAFDERNNRAMSDIIINFNTNGVTRHSMRLPNTYNLRQDVNLDSISASGIKNITEALEATRATQQGGRR